MLGSFFSHQSNVKLGSMSSFGDMPAALSM